VLSQVEVEGQPALDTEALVDTKTLIEVLEEKAEVNAEVEAEVNA